MIMILTNKIKVYSRINRIAMTEVDKTGEEIKQSDIETTEEPEMQRNKAMVTFSKILMFIWGVLIGFVILNPFSYALTFYHFLGFGLITFFIIIFYNGMNASEKPKTVKVKNYVDM